jgi:hypothetical protein
MSDRTLIRPDIDTARCVYTKRRVDEVVRERAQRRAVELEGIARRIAVIDMELAGLNRLRTLELRADLKSSGFDVTGFEPLRCPTELEREPRQHPRQPDVDAMTRARAEEAWSRGRFVRTFNTPIRVR